MRLHFVCSHRSCRQGPTWKAVQRHFVSYGSQAAQLEITHMCMPGCFVSLRSLAFLARMELQQLKGALAENKRSCRPPPIWTRQYLCEYGSEGPPTNGLPGGGGDGGCAGVMLQDADLLAPHQGWASGRFCGYIFGTLGWDRNRGRKKWGHTFWVPDSRLCFKAPNPSLIKV